MYKITLLFLFTISSVNAQTLFEWETAIDNGDNVSETINGITATFSGLPDIAIVNCEGCFGSTENLVASEETDDGTSVTFTFSEALTVNSILAINGTSVDIDYTFTPTGGNNAVVVAAILSGSASVDLNWSGVTSFTVTSSGSLFGFDNLEVTKSLSSTQTLFEWETAIDNGDNVSETINGITATFSGLPDIAIVNCEGCFGSTENIVASEETDDGTSVTFTFSEPLTVNSILAINGNSVDIDYTFTPTGGNNAVVVAAILSGSASVDLNWSGVTSFTVTSSGSLFGFDNLEVTKSLSSTQTLFEWETSIDNGDNVSETINGITATFSGLPDIAIVNCEGCFGSSENLVASEGTDDGTSVTFTFSEPLTVNSILAINGTSVDMDYTFTPTGGNNAVVVAAILSGSASVELNWSGVTSFTVTSSGSLFGFDNLLVDNAIPLSTDDFFTEIIKIFPNPIENILYIECTKTVKSIKVFNSIGQLVLESKNKNLDFSNIKKGIYILNLETETGTIQKKIIKK